MCGPNKLCRVKINSETAEKSLAKHNNGICHGLIRETLSHEGMARSMVDFPRCHFNVDYAIFMIISILKGYLILKIAMFISLKSDRKRPRNRKWHVELAEMWSYILSSMYISVM